MHVSHQCSIIDCLSCIVFMNIEHFDQTMAETSTPSPSHRACPLIAPSNLMQPSPNQGKDDAESIQAKRLHERPGAGGLSDWGVFITLFKGNFGTGILFMPHSWKSGGYAFSAATVWLVGTLAVLSVMRLIKCRSQNTGSYGQLMELAVGYWGQIAIDVSIVLLEGGWVCTCLVSIAELMHRSVLPGVPVSYLICGSALALAPFAAIRKVSLLWPLNLVAFTLLIVGLTIFFSLVVSQLFVTGGLWNELEPFNSHGALVGFGTTCFMFEGIAVLLPTYDSSANPDHFPFIAACVFVVIMILTSSFSFIGYLAFGAHVAPLALLNLTPGWLPNLIQMFIAISVFCTIPLGLLPLSRIVEAIFFERVENPRLFRKCTKNLFRASIVLMLGFIGIIGSSSIDHFVSLVGAFCGVPITFVFPALCHRCLVACSVPEKLLDSAIIMFGLLATVVVTAVNVVQWGDG